MAMSIQTQHIPAGDTTGKMVRATFDVSMGKVDSIELPWDYSLGVEDNHEEAAQALMYRAGIYDFTLLGMVEWDGDNYYSYSNNQ